MKALLIDAYDSFVYIIYQYLLTSGLEVKTVRNTEVTLELINEYEPDFVCLGPGPGHPSAAHYLELIEELKDKTPLLGICLGHQALGLSFGAKVARATHLMHGKTSRIEHDGRGVFSAVAENFRATRYHSLIVEEDELPSCLEVTARARDDRYIMGLRHKSLPIESVQFHPESIYTESGRALFENFVQTHVRS